MTNNKIKWEKISVVLSSYNGDKFIEETILSVLNQTFSNFNFLIVDDGSTDTTVSIIEAFLKKDKRIILFKRLHHGPVDSLNFAIGISKSKWIARIDQDDIWNECKLEKQLAKLNSCKNIKLIGSNCCEIDRNGKIMHSYSYPTSNFFLKNNLKRFKSFFPHSSSLFSRIVFKKIGGYKPAFYMADDWNLWVNFSFYGKISSINEALVKIRRHNLQRSFFDSGITQITHAIASSIFLYDSKLRNKNDHFFLKWVSDELIKINYFEKRKKLNEFKGSLYSKKNFLNKGSIFFMFFICNPVNLIYIYEKLFGSGLPRQLSRKWREK